jgi:cell division protein FtsI/penicillin-binding protein 2
VARVANSRIRLLLLCILLVFAALLARASWIATVRASALSQMAQIQTKATVVLPAGRGTIFDSMGTPLALGERRRRCSRIHARCFTRAQRRGRPRARS